MSFDILDKMRKVFCPKSGKVEWANWGPKVDGGEGYRCCKCGQRHDPIPK